MPPREALRLAETRGLDLVEIVPTANPPVCKLVDYGKYMYELTKKEKAKLKGQTSAQLKEVRFHPNTDDHDFLFKSRHAKEFLEQGHKVKGTVFFKGREITYVQHGEELLKRFIEFLDDVGKVEQMPKLEGKSMAVIIAPDKSKKKSGSKVSENATSLKVTASRNEFSPDPKGQSVTDASGGNRPKIKLEQKQNDSIKEK
jgi:translation initiation factor IF-3